MTTTSISMIMQRTMIRTSIPVGNSSESSSEVIVVSSAAVKYT